MTDRHLAIPGSMTTGAMLALAVTVLALPSAVLAFTSRFEALDETGAETGAETGDGIDSLGSAGKEGVLASAIPVRSLVNGRPFRFTPAGTPTRPDRSVTVAVRVDPQVVREITVRASRSARGQAATAPIPLQMASSAFNLGVARGYQSFAQQAAPQVEIRRIEMPDLSSFPKGGGATAPQPRFTARLQADERPPTGRAPRTFSGDGESKVDLGGSLRLTKNLDVTAGVRYTQDRERIRPLTDGKQDNQAVYVGTQFRF